MIHGVVAETPGGEMVRRSWLVLLVVVLVAAVGVVAGCVESSEEDAQTPTGATTIPNTALQTDSEGNFVTAPAEEATGGGEEGGGEEPPPGEGGGDVDAGLQVFQQNCSTCHAQDGNAAGVGPQLAGAGLTAEQVRTTVQNGRGIMPAGLVSGEDLENVVAYVVSLQ